MKKIAVVLFLLVCLINIFPPSVYALGDLIKPNSRLYFLQSWAESIRLALTFSNEEKLNYLLNLTDKRVEEMNTTSSPQLANRYENHFQQMEQLVNQTQNKEQAVEKIKEANLRQQAVLAKVYNQVPENAKDAIINAQENSSKNVAQTIERVEGIQAAQQYIERVTMIQQAEKMGQVERLEQAPMESGPNTDPSQSTPRELKENKGLLPGQNLNSLNPALDQQGGNSGSNRMEPVSPTEMNAPVGQY